jgi:hypothetical protein
MRRFLVALCLLAGCGDPPATIDDPLCKEPAEWQWQTVNGDLDRSALALWGRSDDDLYVVGGALGAPGGALVLHKDAGGWSEIPTGSDATLWWVWGAPGAATDVWMVGENGTILRYDGARVTEVPSGTAAHLYGVWGSSSSDVIIVGGRPGPEEGPDDVVLHWDGRALTAVELPEAKGAALFKVWGASPDDLWVTGESGTIWHRTASGWVDESLPDVFDTLATVHGCSAGEVYAVGGRSVYRRGAGGWAEVPGLDLFAATAGVSCGEDGVLVVGSGGLKLRLDRATGEWIDETRQAPYDTDFHGAWVSPAGSSWAAGGNYIAPASQIDRRTGILAVRGCRD